MSRKPGGLFSNWRGSSSKPSLNSEQEHFGNIQCSPKKDYMPKAYCTSGACAGRGTYVKRVHKKNVDRRKAMCPDCGHVLFWE